MQICRPSYKPSDVFLINISLFFLLLGFQLKALCWAGLCFHATHLRASAHRGRVLAAQAEETLLTDLIKDSLTTLIRHECIPSWHISLILSLAHPPWARQRLHILNHRSSWSKEALVVTNSVTTGKCMLFVK